MTAPSAEHPDVPTAQAAARENKLQSATWRVGARDLAGFVHDPADPLRRFVVELLIDGLPAGVARADRPTGATAPAEFGDCGFSFALNLEFSARVEIRLANDGAAVGAPLDWSDDTAEEAEDGPGEVFWDGGLRLTGWVGGDPARPQSVRAIVDGATVVRRRASGWTHRGEGAAARAFRRFELDLPQKFADGRVHFVEIRDEDGVELAASPCPVVAYDKGLSHFLAERADIAGQKPLADIFDKITPQTLPFADFSSWRDAFAPPEAALDGEIEKIAVALVGGDDFDATVASLDAQRGVKWVGAALEGGPSAIAFDPGLLRGFIEGEAADVEAIVFAPAGVRLAPDALAQLAAALKNWPDAPFVYCDFAIASEGGAWPLALPAYDYERHLEQGFCALFFAARKNFVEQALAKGAADLFRLTFCARESRGAEDFSPTPVHLPQFLAELPAPDAAALGAPLAAAVRAHLFARGVTAAVAADAGASLPSVHVRRALGGEKISILIPTRDRAELLGACLDSLARTIDPARCEILIIDNDSSEPETLRLFAEISRRSGKIVSAPGPFNFSRLINLGAAAARGDHLLLLNNDVEALHPGWLDEMAGRLREPDVGAVGATLLWPSRVVQHGGVVLGPKFAALHAFNDRIDGDPGFGDSLCAAHEASAVTAACLLTPRARFEAEGGLDEQKFPVNFNDVDYCLNLRARGLRIVMTPRAKLLHWEQASRGADRRPDQAARFQRELALFRARWGAAIVADPFYNPQLALDQTPFSALACPPRPRAPRRPDAPPPRPIPPGF